MAGYSLGYTVCRAGNVPDITVKPYERVVTGSRNPHDPAGSDGLRGAEVPAPETGDAEVLAEWFSLIPGHPEYPHGAEIDAGPAPVAEDAVYGDLHQDCRRRSYFQRDPPGELSFCSFIYHSLPVYQNSRLLEYPRIDTLMRVPLPWIGKGVPAWISRHSSGRRGSISSRR